MFAAVFMLIIKLQYPFWSHFKVYNVDNKISVTGNIIVYSVICHYLLKFNNYAICNFVELPTHLLYKWRMMLNNFLSITSVQHYHDCMIDDVDNNVSVTHSIIVYNDLLLFSEILVM